MEFKNIKTLETYFLDILNTRSIKILEKIADEYNINKDELIGKYVDVNNVTIEPNLEDVKNDKEITDDIINDNFRCIAMTKANTRCKRSKRNADYCNIHLKKLKIII
jgi:hypothetical protein